MIDGSFPEKIFSHRMIFTHFDKNLEYECTNILFISFFFSAMAYSSTNHQRVQIQRSTNDVHSLLLRSSSNIKPAREVTLRVKFIRLGEVKCFIFVSFSLLVVFLHKRSLHYTRNSTLKLLSKHDGCTIQQQHRGIRIFI